MKRALLGSDPGETLDFAEKKPNVVRRLRDLMNCEHVWSAAIPLPLLDEASEPSAATQR